MIPKALAISLFAAGTALATVGLVSLWKEVSWAGPLGEGYWAEAGLDYGNMRLVLARQTSDSPKGWGVGWPLGWFGRCGCYVGVNRNNWRYGVLVLPLWVLVGLLFIHPSVAFVRGPVRRWRRRRRNQCIHCGYDLTGNTTGICPECGNSAGGPRADGIACDPDAGGNGRWVSGLDRIPREFQKRTSPSAARDVARGLPDSANPGGARRAT